MIGIWRQLAPVAGVDGKPYEIGGTGGSWFRYARNHQWSWQRDFFDHTNAGKVFAQMANNQQLTPKMIERLQKRTDMPGWVRRSEFDWYATIEDREA